MSNLSPLDVRIRYDDKITLQIYEGDYELASFDHESLELLAYAAAAKIDIATDFLYAPHEFIFYRRPRMSLGNIYIDEYEDVIPTLKEFNFDIDKNMSARQISESFAISTSVSSNLKPVNTYLRWFEQRNLNNFTTVWYMNSLLPPMNHIHIRRLKSRATSLIRAKYPCENDMEEMKRVIVSKATQCIAGLSQRLGKSDYFHGDKPTSLDCTIYSHLAPLVKLPLEVNEMYDVLTILYPNLNNFIKRFDKDYMDKLDLPTPKIRVKKPPEYNCPHNHKDDDLNCIALFVFAFSCGSLVCYAFTKGVFRLPL